MQETILPGHEKWKRAKRFPGCSLLFVGLQSSVIICEALIEYEIVFLSCCYSFFLPHWGPQSPTKSNNKWQCRSMPFWLVSKLTWLKVRFFRQWFCLGRLKTWRNNLLTFETHFYSTFCFPTSDIQSFCVCIFSLSRLECSYAEVLQKMK